MTTFYNTNRPLGAQTTTNQQNSSLPSQQSSQQQQFQQQQQPQQNYDFSPLANQVYPYGSNGGASANGGAGVPLGSANGNGVGSNGNGYIYNNSPLNNNAMLNQSTTSNAPYNNLNLSMRNNTASNIYPTPRGANLSPNLNFASLYSARARFHASKGFDLEDDLEFCPEIHEHFSSNSHHLHPNNVSHHQQQQHYKFNPYTSHSFSPQNSPTSTANTTSPVTKKEMDGQKSPRVITPRAKKVLEIVNPATGLRVSSPAPYK